MQVTGFSDYCFRILIYLAVSDSGYASVREIAEAYDISANHTAKAAQWLVRQGYVTATRGKGGGLRLAAEPKNINVGHVMRVAEAGNGLVACMRSGRDGCAIDGVCGLAPILDEAHEAFFNVLDGYTLADAIKKKPALARRLRVPA